MATDGEGALDITLEAGQSLASDQYKLLALATDGQVDVVAATSTLSVIGVLQNEPAAAGQAAQIRVYGVAKVIAGEVIDEGELLCPSAVTAGRVDDADTSTDRIIGVALEPAAAAGVVFRALLLPGGAQVP